jgi:hypothetical protein
VLTGLLMLLAVLMVAAIFILFASLIGVAMAGSALRQLRNMLRRPKDADAEPDRSHDA